MIKPYGLFLIKRKNIIIMKKHLSKFMALFFVALALSFGASAQLIVKIRPSYTVVRTRPIAPSPRHVWVEDEWVWRNGNYEHVDGYWAEPAPGFHEWVPGHWRGNDRRGWRWIPGHWR
jgi:YXWGXW repeat-containing protein